MAHATIDTARVAKRERWGFLCGATMALGASLSFAAARAGILGGLLAVDMIFARFIVAGLIMLPLLIRFGIRDLAELGWRRALVLTLLGGAPFALLADQSRDSLIGVGGRSDGLDKPSFGCARGHLECPHDRMHRMSPESSIANG